MEKTSRRSGSGGFTRAGQALQCRAALREREGSRGDGEVCNSCCFDRFPDWTNICGLGLSVVYRFHSYVRVANG
eukprot:2778550-Pyramimonas_sp.AAC.1